LQPLEGDLNAEGCRFGIVVSRFNEFVTTPLLTSALETLKSSGAQEQHIQIIRVPGAFEIPFIAHQLALFGRLDAIICLGAVIRGETPHFDYISAEVSRGIAQASLETDTPIIFGVLTTDTVDQALERAGSSERNRGVAAARSAIEMARLMKQMRALGFLKNIPE
jgi:6,7-dimethyl-8-ribityllumazine synthase